MPSHRGEDIALARYLSDIERGFYVDVGAHDPFTSSNSHPFYLRGWSGIDIEPLPQIAAKLREAHPRNNVFECAIGAYDGYLDLFVPGLLELATLRRDIAVQHLANGFGEFYPLRVRQRTLTGILQECVVPTIDFMSIDVEGSERDLIAGLDLRVYRPRVLLIEATVPNSQIPCWDEWEPKVLEASYLFAEFDGYNRFYVRSEDACRLGK